MGPCIQTFCFNGCFVEMPRIVHCISGHLRTNRSPSFQSSPSSTHQPSSIYQPSRHPATALRQSPRYLLIAKVWDLKGQLDQVANHHSIAHPAVLSSAISHAFHRFVFFKYSCPRLLVPCCFDLMPWLDQETSWLPIWSKTTTDLIYVAENTPHQPGPLVTMHSSFKRNRLADATGPRTCGRSLT